MMFRSDAFKRLAEDTRWPDGSVERLQDILIKYGYTPPHRGEMPSVFIPKLLHAFEDMARRLDEAANDI